MMQKTIFLLILQLVNVLPSGAQDPEELQYTNHIFNDNIKTVQLYKDGWNLSYPIISLKSDEKLLLNFDLLGNTLETYYYTFIHCDKDWNKSDIFPNDYLEGFPENPIEDYKTSFNTTVNYVHYRLSFPNDRVQIKLSGNYVVIVYPMDTPDKPVLSQRFIVSEDALSIDVDAHRPRMTRDLNTNQQVDFTVGYQGTEINDPYRDIFAFILQNGRWDDSRKNLKPEFYNDNELRYSALSDKNIFPGGNEYRYFDFKSLRYLSEYVRKIDFLVSNYNVYLAPSENREFKPYFYWADFNGKYYIAVQEQKNPDTDADYAYVYFTLPAIAPLPGGRMYVSGALNNWSFDTNNVMVYNPDHAAYECIMLLKQGWYNYEYVFRPDGSDLTTATRFEGSHYETENDYLVLIYYRNPLERYDRLLGTRIANTLNRISD